ncbi:MAG: hypothetical protein LBB09_01640 [Rickettsiales bacterium]|nr:hypothetical protein [Rickettsiales bacterium]
MPKEPSTGGYSPSNDPQPKQPLQTLPLSDKKSPQSPMPPGKNGAGPMETAQPGEKERNMSTSLVAERKNKHFLEEEINNDEEKSIKRKKQSQHTHLQKLGESRTPNASSFPNH